MRGACGAGAMNKRGRRKGGGVKVRAEEMSRVLRDLAKLLRKLSAEEWYMMTIGGVERHFEEIKRELGQWFCEDAEIFAAS